MTGDEPGDRALPRPRVVRARREAKGPEVPAERHDPRLVDRAVPVDPVAERAHHGLAVAGEQGRRAEVRPPASARDPAGEGEVVQRHHRRETCLAHHVGHPPVVVELVLRDGAVLGLDPRPLDGVPVGVEPEARQRGDVLRVAAVVVAGDATPVDARGVRTLLPVPPVAVGVAALDLVGRRRRAPEERRGEDEVGHRMPPSAAGRRQPLAPRNNTAILRGLTADEWAGPAASIRATACMVIELAAVDPKYSAAVVSGLARSLFV